MQLDAGTVFLQWATGGLLFLWVTTRRRQVGIGYGWLLRVVYGIVAMMALAIGVAFDPVPLRDICSAGVAAASAIALVVSVVRRRAGVSGEREQRQRREARVAAMTGAPEPSPDEPTGQPEFPPVLDLLAVPIGAAGLVAGALVAGGPALLAIGRVLAGAAFLGAVSDAMLLGHWYLVQPGLDRAPIHELNTWLARLWPLEVGLLLVPTGMVQVLTGRIDDGYGGILGWFWIACAVTTIVLSFVTKAALRERAYSAVMAATGLLYLAILTAFGTDLVARAVLAG